MLIGLTGRAGAGKDTVAAVARTIYPYANVENRKFAGKLYESAAAALGVSVESLERWKRGGVTIRVGPTGTGFVLTELSVREYLQRYGTEAHRDTFHPDFWIDQVDLSHEGRIVFVTDVRFPNEAEAIRRAGGHVVLVEGPGDIVPAHSSEEGLPESMIDAIVDNSIRGDNLLNLVAEVRWLLTEGTPGTLPLTAWDRPTGVAVAHGGEGGKGGVVIMYGGGGGANPRRTA